MTDLTGWNFDNSYTELPSIFYSKTSPEPVSSPKLIVFNEELAETLGLDGTKLKEEGAAIFAGNQLPAGAEPIAQAYAGHQFGNFTMLGDGRAVLLGEQLTADGRRMDIQLKGAGRTPFSRGGDGRAAVGPMLREYLISEAMHALGIPTTRSLAVTATGDTVVRETELPGAILTRVAASHLRVGTFQYAANWGTIDDLRELADYAIERHDPDLQHTEDRYIAFLQRVIERQAELIAKWQLVGFIHGVMNTDNMTISGETIDYGPCAFMDVYSPKTVFSSIDLHSRYAYGNQPYIGGWNLARLAESLLPLLHEEEEQALELANDALSSYANSYERHWLAGMRAKLGLADEDEQDPALINELLELMEQYEADFTNTFRALTLGEREGSKLLESNEFSKWNAKWQERLSAQALPQAEVQQVMKQSNPAVIPRNHRVEEALDAAEAGDVSKLERLHQVLSSPFAYTDDQEEYTTLPEPPDRPYRTFCGT